MAQEFDWMETGPRRDGSAAFNRQFEQAVRERARLMFNLNYTVTEAVRRIRLNLDWEFDTTIWPRKSPAFFEQVPTWVQAVYTQMTPTRAPRSA